MGMCLFFFQNFPGATFIQGDMFIPDSRVHVYIAITKLAKFVCVRITLPTLSIFA
jgi:hypothetical protein